jgi:glutamate:GABA antiporter
MLAIVWSITFLNFLAIKKSTLLNAFGAWLGILIPSALIAVLGVIWLISGNKSQIDFHFNKIIPHLSINNFVFLLGVFSSYAGMQILGFHVKNVERPERDIPKAMMRSILIIVPTTVFAALAIAVVVPKGELSLVSSVFEGFKLLLARFHLGWALYIIIFMIIVGGLSSTSSWLIGPARGMATAAQEGVFPRCLGKENKNGMPVNVLLMQGIVASILSSLFLFAPNLSTAFWMLMALTSQFTLVMDILIFASVIKLRYSEPTRKRPFKIPGGLLGVWLIAGFSVSACIFAIILGYFPPATLKVGSIWRYETILLTGNFIYLVVPFLIYFFNKAAIKKRNLKLVP